MMVVQHAHGHKNCSSDLLTFAQGLSYGLSKLKRRGKNFEFSQLSSWAKIKNMRLIL